jgi:hypothetical protein
MKRLATIVAWLCIFSILFVGCYSVVLVDPTDAENVRINSGNIEHVFTKDGKKYEFEKPPSVANDQLVGEATVTANTQVKQEETSVPLSDVAYIRKSDSGKTEYVVTKAGAKYMYEEPPAVLNGAVVGKAKFAGFAPIKEQVSIPLSDIQKVEASQLNVADTVVGVVLGGALVAGVTYALVLSTIKIW